MKCYSSTAQVSKTDGGYFFPPDALRDTVAGWRADHETVSVLRQGMGDLKNEFDSQAERMKDQLEELQTELSKERRESKLQLKRAKVNYFLLGAVIGAAAGAIAASK